ncbi:MAG: carboxypeptidase regulatory-like domain-containing protein [Candidatus Acidiferrales bacterium]
MQKTVCSFGRVFLLLLLALSLSPVLALAQNAITGELKGTVTDPSGAVVPGVSVSIKNVQTGVVTPTTTNPAGLYDVPFLQPGQYTLTFSKQGFRDFVREGIALQIETLEVSVTLQLGASSQEVVVNSQAPLVETETTEQHVDLDTQAVASAPIVGFDWRASLVEMSPGINTGGGAGMANGQGVGVNGTQGYNVNFMIDGTAATSIRDYNSSNNLTPIDTIAEVSINSGNAGAQYGNGLSIFNAVTKSGNNQWHGSAFEYDQNTILNARGFFNQTGAKSTSHYNLFGGTVGGPVIKNKLFFFFAYQRTPSSSPTQSFYSYPTAAMEAGDFYGVPGYTNATYFSGTGALLATKDPVALKIQSYLPASTAPGWVTGCPGPANVSATVTQTCPNGGTNDYNYTASIPGTSTWYEGKVDYNISSKQKLTFSFNYYPNFVEYVPGGPLSATDASNVNSGNNYNLTGQLTDVYTITPMVLNEFRVGAQRELDAYVEWSLNKNDPTTLGLLPAYGFGPPNGNVAANVFPNITISNGAGSGGFAMAGSINAVLGQGVYSAFDVLTIIHGRHTIKVGGEYDRDYQNYTGWGNISSGQFTFTGAVTGIPYADFLSGDVETWNVYNDDATSARMWNTALFINDDFKVSSHVTLNLGLRWGVQSGWSATGDLFGTYDPLLPNPGVSGNPRGAILYGGASDAAYGGPQGNRNTIQNADYKEFAPRIGIAWSPREKWSVRASYGIFDAPRPAESYTDGALGLGFNPAGYMSGSPAFKLATGPPPGSITYPTLQTLSPAIANYKGVVFYPANMPTQYVQEGLLDVQHEFAGGILVDAGYFYTRGANLGFETDIDQAPISQLGCTGYNCGNPIPWYTSIVAQIYDGWSNYNALQIRLQKRMSYGLNFLVNYAWSKSLDTGTGNGHGQGVDIYQNAYSPLANYGLSDFNASNTLTGQIVWELPFGSGRHYAVHGVADEIVGGWRVSSLFQWHTGVPFTPVIQNSIAAGSTSTGIDPGLNSALNAYDFNNGTPSTLYPEQICNPTVSSPTLTGWFNPACFANPAHGTFGNMQRNSLSGPNFSDVDFSIAKDFPLHIREAMILQIRADMFNVFNHPSFGNPDANVGYGSTPCPAGHPNAGLDLADCTAGTVTSVRSGSRIIQIGVHFTF